jgi:hypothetical protein
MRMRQPLGAFLLGFGLLAVGYVTPWDALPKIVIGVFGLVLIVAGFLALRERKELPPSDDGDHLVYGGPGSKSKFTDSVAVGYDGPKLDKDAEFTAERSRIYRHQEVVPDGDPPRGGAVPANGRSTDAQVAPSADDERALDAVHEQAVHDDGAVSGDVDADIHRP